MGIWTIQLPGTPCGPGQHHLNYPKNGGNDVKTLNSAHCIVMVYLKADPVSPAIQPQDCAGGGPAAALPWRTPQAGGSLPLYKRMTCRAIPEISACLSQNL